jgi:hypothetical protein
LGSAQSESFFVFGEGRAARGFGRAHQAEETRARWPAASAGPESTLALLQPNSAARGPRLEVRRAPGCPCTGEVRRAARIVSGGCVIEFGSGRFSCSGRVGPTDAHSLLASRFSVSCFLLFLGVRLATVAGRVRSACSKQQPASRTLNELQVQGQAAGERRRHEPASHALGAAACNAPPNSTSSDKMMGRSRPHAYEHRAESARARRRNAIIEPKVTRAQVGKQSSPGRT